MKRLLSILALCLLLTGCGVFSDPAASYKNETPTAQLPTDGKEAKELCRLIRMMVQNTPYLTPFDSPGEAADLYRDGILCAVLTENYAKYNANADLIARAKEAHPLLEVTTVIPALDFESTVYRCFGGSSSVGNLSTPLFTYFSDIDVYVSVGIGVDNSADIFIEDLYETEHTYVCAFYNEMNGQRSDVYRLLAVKREDGTVYIKSLEIQNKREG
ncbi:MAG: hypothetical protein IJU41_03970 [Clostridia bacterium]|nr:hypothetical protein [Clostridia bacterium]